MSRGTPGAAASLLLPPTGLSPSAAGLSSAVPLLFRSVPAAPYPGALRAPVWAPPVSLAATPGITFVFFSSGYLDVSVRRVPPGKLWIHLPARRLFLRGLPHSDTCGSSGICPSPQLFAACRVFLRPPVPRHPPCALSSLAIPVPPSVGGRAVLLMPFPGFSFSFFPCIPLPFFYILRIRLPEPWCLFSGDVFWFSVVFGIRFSRYVPPASRLWRRRDSNS